MVSPPRGLTRRRMGRFQGEVPVLGKVSVGPTLMIDQAEPAPSFHALFERGQQAFGPHRGFCPGPAAQRVSVVFSRGRHCRRWWVSWCQRPASIFLRPFAPPALPGFNATMGALTPVRPALRPARGGNEHRPLTGQVSLCHGPHLPTLPSPNTPRRPARLVWFPTRAYRRTPPGGASSLLGNPCVIWASP